MHWWVLVHQHSPHVPGWVQDSKVQLRTTIFTPWESQSTGGLIGSYKCSLATFQYLATGTCDPPAGMLQLNSHYYYPCHKQTTMEPPMDPKHAVCQELFALGTKGSRVNLLVNNRGASKQTVLSLRSIQMDVGDCINIQTPHPRPLQGNYIQISTPSVKQQKIVLGQTAIFIKGCSM